MEMTDRSAQKHRLRFLIAVMLNLSCLAQKGNSKTHQTPGTHAKHNSLLRQEASIWSGNLKIGSISKGQKHNKKNVEAARHLHNASAVTAECDHSDVMVDLDIHTTLLASIATESASDAR